ncbi:MAG: hypothetical protein ACO1ON_03875 [Nocardioides sp.]|uniref:hypothetical protein n=1 Tax=Nocardioides sp. TaxID=35761 RepID=UPI0026047A25|nr:hypothetical protein [Nocardioides sp.]
MAPPRRAQVRRGGLVGLGLGLGLLSLAVFFLTAPLEAPEQVLGVFLPLAVGMLALPMGVLALAPLWLGDTPRTARRLAPVLAAVALLGLGLTGWGVARGDLPWTLGAVAPLAVAALLLGTARRLARAEDRSVGPGSAPDQVADPAD